MIKINAIANQLLADFQLKSLLLYGSYAQQTQDDKSDIDLLAIVEGAIPSTELRKRSYQRVPHLKIVKLDFTADHATDWDNSWSPINDRLKLDEQIIEIGYNTSSWVKCVIDNLIVKHQISFAEFPFRPYTFLGLLESSHILIDQEDFLSRCKSQIRPMPPAIKRAIIDTFMPVLIETSEELLDYQARDIGILAYAHHLFHGLDAAVQLLFVVNEVYDPASKRTEALLYKLQKLPPNLRTFFEQILPRFYEKRAEVSQFFKELIQFTNENRN